METYAIIAIFALLYAFLDAWHDEKIIRKQNKGLFNWHQIDAVIKTMVASVLAYFVAGWTWEALWIVVGILAVRWIVFDWTLNRLMAWDKNSRNWLDAVPYWIRGIVLLIVVIILITLQNGNA